MSEDVKPEIKYGDLTRKQFLICDEIMRVCFFPIHQVNIDFEKQRTHTSQDHGMDILLYIKNLYDSVHEMVADTFFREGRTAIQIQESAKILKGNVLRICDEYASKFEELFLFKNLVSVVDLLETKEYLAGKKLIEIGRNRFIAAFETEATEGRQFTQEDVDGLRLSYSPPPKDNWRGTVGQLADLMSALEEQSLIGPHCYAFAASKFTVNGKDVTGNRLSSDLINTGKKAKAQITKVLEKANLPRKK